MPGYPESGTPQRAAPIPDRRRARIARHHLIPPELETGPLVDQVDELARSPARIIARDMDDPDRARRPGCSRGYDGVVQAVHGAQVAVSVTRPRRDGYSRGAAVTAVAAAGSCLSGAAGRGTCPGWPGRPSRACGTGGGGTCLPSGSQECPYLRVSRGLRLPVTVCEDTRALGWGRAMTQRVRPSSSPRIQA